MTEEEGLKARVADLTADLGYYLLNYNRLIGLGFRKRELDAAIEQTKRDLEKAKTVSA